MDGSVFKDDVFLFIGPLSHFSDINMDEDQEFRDGVEPCQNGEFQSKTAEHWAAEAMAADMDRWIIYSQQYAEETGESLEDWLLKYRPSQVSRWNTVSFFMQKFGFINGVDNVNWPPYRDSKSCSSLYGGQFTLSTPLIKPNFCILLPHRRSTTVSLETTPSFISFFMVQVKVLYFLRSTETCPFPFFHIPSSFKLSPMP